VEGAEADPARRCRRCFELRLGMTAAVAAERGLDAVATTLTVSPYQDHDSIVDAGRAACSAYGVAFLETDYRDRYREASRRSRELGMYRQDYCGCVYSQQEAAAQRAERAERKRQSAGAATGAATS
jgi:epoxyqueuosine reductase